MPWSLYIVAPDGKPLGKRHEVVTRISTALPEIKWVEGPSSFGEGHAFLQQLPLNEEQRSIFSLPKLTGTIEGDQCSIRLSGFESYPSTDSVNVEVSGDGNPLPVLAKVCSENRWTLVGETDEQQINFKANATAEWETFCQREMARRNTLYGPPEKIRIPHDDHRFEFVGRYDDGKQFMAFVTGAFPDDVKLNFDTDEWRKVKSWMAVLHLFDSEGNHISSESRLGGYDIESRDVAGDKAWEELDAMLVSLKQKNFKLSDIYVKLFSKKIDGVTHGLVYEVVRPEEDGPIIESVFLEPRDIMFHPPWDSGKYST